jgi:formyltetrahydrofolate deformylase
VADLPTSSDRRSVVLTLSCPDRIGVVLAVARFLADRRFNIVESQQYGDGYTGRFFMRVQAEGLAGEGAVATPDELRSAMAPLAAELGMSFELHDTAEVPTALIMVSRQGHCLNDLLYRWRINALGADVVAVVSNHPDFESLVASYGLPFHHLPVPAGRKPEQEARVLEVIADTGADFVVLARYMQILSGELVARLASRVINIHHSFLPSFAGARPYHQAHARGVKIIGATAHYVTEQLDEGPIIEQEVARVDHGLGPEDLQAVGRDLECVALARAVRWHAEHRVLLNGDKTVVFR